MAGALVKGARITGTPRVELAAELSRRYTAGESIRAIADDTGRSFGFVHGLIKEAGTGLRGRGGATRGAAARTTRTSAPASGPVGRRATPAAEPAGTTKAGGAGRKAAGPAGKAADSGTNGHLTSTPLGEKGAAKVAKGAKKDSGKGAKKDSSKKDGARWTKRDDKKDDGKKDGAKKDGKKAKKR